MKRVNNQLLYYRLLVISIGIFFLGSCQKEINADAIKANSAMKANAAAGSTIIYTDVNPDTTVICSTSPCSKIFNFDLNNDGKNDFQVSSFKSQLKLASRSIHVTITALSGNAVAIDTSLPLKMISGEKIASATNWDSTADDQILEAFHQSCVECPGFTSGNWYSSANEGYVGLKIKKGKRFYYGWMRLNVSVPSLASSFTIKDYAYNSTPGQPILAGQTQ